jgi:phosphoglycolate phosphatase-like HAD superfamily hydrolase
MCVVFDFDGTLSWLRHGWPQLMLRVCARHSRHSANLELKDESELIRQVLSLNGQPSIHQISLLKSALGVDSMSVQDLLSRYTDALRAEVSLRAQSVTPGLDDFLIFGSRRFLKLLLERGVKLVLLSGTYEEDVRREVALLGLNDYFGEHIYGSPVQGDFCKRTVMQGLLERERIEGAELIAIGDGPVEIAAAKGLGGRAIGVASDEDTKWSHAIDQAKEKILIAAGADLIVPDYVDVDGLLCQIFRDER